MVNECRYQGTLQLIERFATDEEILEVGSATAYFTAC